MKTAVLIVLLSCSSCCCFSQTYTFTGNGNWTIPSNWLNNIIPPDTLPSGSEIIISPGVGNSCILNVTQSIAFGATLTITPGANFIVQGNLIFLPNPFKLLKKIVFTTVGSSEIDSSMFFYDSDNRLIRNEKAGSNGTSSYNTVAQITRNASGIITNWSFNAGTTNFTGTVHYDQLTSRYKSCVVSFSLPDSAVYYYLGDKINLAEHYIKGLFGNPNYQLMSKDTFAYDVNGNVINQKDFDYTGGVWVLSQTQTMTYDNKVSPLPLSNESIILAHAELANFEGKNNELTFISSYGNTRSTNYNYNANNEPATATSTDNNGEIINNEYSYY